MGIWTSKRYPGRRAYPAHMEALFKKTHVLPYHSVWATSDPISYVIRGETYLQDHLKNIDDDQIMENYHSTSTAQPSISKFPSITLTAGKDNFARQGQNCLPPELCSDFIHGCKVFISRDISLRIISNF